MLRLAQLILLAGLGAGSAQNEDYELIEVDHVYTDPETKGELHGCLIYQNIPGNPIRPGMLLNPGFWGDGGGESERYYARQFARRGMAVLIPDFLMGRHSDENYLTFTYSFLIYETFLGDTKRAMRRIGLAYDTLTAQPFVNASAMGAIGFCFGGAMTLNLARTGRHLRVIASNHGEYPDGDFREYTTWNVDYLLEGIGERDPIISPKMRHEWTEELRFHVPSGPEATETELATHGYWFSQNQNVPGAQKYELVVWENNVHGFSIDYSTPLYNVFQFFALSKICWYNWTTANATFARIDELFKEHELLPADAPPTITPVPTRCAKDYVPPGLTAADIYSTCERDPGWMVYTGEWIGNTFGFNGDPPVGWYRQTLVPYIGHFLWYIDPEGESLGAVIFLLIVIVVSFGITCCTCLCKLCCCPLRRMRKQRGVPKAESATFQCVPAWQVALLLFVLNLPFMGMFFCTVAKIAPTRQWPIAWWSLIVLQFWPLHVIATKVKITSDTVAVLGIFGNLIAELKLDQVEAVNEEKKMGCECLVLVKTAAGYEAQRAEAACSCCKVCVGKKITIPFKSSEDLSAVRSRLSGKGSQVSYVASSTSSAS